MNDDRLAQDVTSFANAVARLGEALRAVDTDEFAADAAVQRFEFTFELAWKCLKRALATEGISRETPRSVLKESYRIGWISDEETWLAMIADRNLTSHVYSEERARAVLSRIAGYHGALESLTTLFETLSTTADASSPRGDEPGESSRARS